MQSQRSSSTTSSPASPRVIVGLIDGAEPTFIESQGYRNLLLREHGATSIPKSLYHPEVDVPWSPLVWASFLKGRPVSISEIEVAPGLYLTPPPTIRDKIKAPSLFIDVPTLTFPWKLRRLEDMDVKKLSETYLRQFKARRKRILESLDKGYQAVFFYLSILDIYGHIWWQHREIMRRVYGMVDSLIGEIREKAPEAVILLLSDHGMKPLEGHRHAGRHSDHGFYSSSYPLGLEKPSITDLHWAVVDLIEKLANPENQGSKGVASS